MLEGLNCKKGKIKQKTYNFINLKNDSYNKYSTNFHNIRRKILVLFNLNLNFILYSNILIKNQYNFKIRDPV